MKEKQVQVKIRMPQHLKEELEASASKCGQSVTSLVRYLLAEALHGEKEKRRRGEAKLLRDVTRGVEE